MKRVVKAMAVFAFLTTMILNPCVVPARAVEFTIRAAFIGAESHGSYIALEKLKSEIKAITDGMVSIELYPNAQLGSDRQAIEGISIGTLEMAVVGGAS